MSEVDKENRLPATTDAASKRPLTSKTSANITSSPSSIEPPLGQVSVAFPAEDPDADRDMLASDGKTLRSKRSVLFYGSANSANKSNQQPFSRSAAKRESILALGSIGYLQHLYTKQGIANRKRPMMKGAMTLAIGPAGEAMMSSEGDEPGALTDSDIRTRGRASSSQTAEEDEGPDCFDLPPSPEAGTFTRPRYLDVARPLEADTQALRALLVADLRRLSEVWALSEWIARDSDAAGIRQVMSADTSNSESPNMPPSTSVDLLSVIDVTTKAIRSVRSYILALPQRSKIPTTAPNEPIGRDRYKRQSSFSGVSRPGQVGTPVPTRTSEILHHSLAVENSSAKHPLSKPSLERRNSSTQDTDDAEQLVIIRKAALEMLSTLKDLEARNRVEVLDANGEGTLKDSSQEQDAPTKLALSIDPDESNISAFAGRVSGTGYLYRSDIKLADLAPEQKVLQGYLKTVNAVLTCAEACILESRRDGRRSSNTGTLGEHEAIMPTGTSHSAFDSAPCIRLDSSASSNSSDASLDWRANGLSTAKRASRFMIDLCGACVGEELNEARLKRLIDAKDDLERLLPMLYDGYLLCRALNEAVRRSDKPWGYISSREMHDLEAEEAALLHKGALRLKQAQEDEAVKFQTRSDRRTASEDNGGIIETEARAKSLESENLLSRPGWTFRRSENLRVWAAALKLRYHIQTTATRAVASKPVKMGPTYGSLGMGKLALHGRRVASESHASASDLPHGSSRTIDFDPAKIARKEDGWQEMLITLLTAWIEAVAEEQASEANIV
ncbi:hypothetical protein NDA11_005972 [Ustilago hordei]|nr:hypothetical protein NDA11_005972 [Ustilago hordei]